MKNVCIALLFFIIASCQKAPTEASDRIMDEPFELGVGESVTLKPDNVQVGFDTVISDSRCPIGVICIWEGEAQIKIQLSKQGSAPLSATLTIRGYVTAKDTCCHKYIDINGYRIKLMQLDPYPTHPVPNDYTNYRATLLVTRTGR